jgi:hypothetical protein
MTIPATTMKTEDGAVMAKAAVGNPDINDEVDEPAYGQLLIHGKAITGVQMTTAWHYRDGTGHCSARSRKDGTAQCALPPLGFGTRDGDTVVVDVTFAYGAHLYSSRTSFRPSND